MIKRASLACLIICAQLLLPLATTRAQQPQPTPTQQPQPPSAAVASTDGDDEVVRITTNLVQVDAVVTDRDGKRVTDLRPEDFDLSEDGKPQSITNFSYIEGDATPAVAPPAKPASASSAPLPPVRLRPEQVQRTIALVVDDLHLSFASMYYTRRALKKFVDKEMLPGDLVAIIRTSAGIGALQQFTADKNVLRAAIERVRLNLRSRNEDSPFAPINSSETARQAAILQGNGALDTTGLKSPEDSDALRDDIYTLGALGAVNYVVRGMRPLPGRKSVMLFSDGFVLFDQDDKDGSHERVRSAFNQLIDLANRASTVVYTLDPRGVVVTEFEAGDNLSGLISAPQALANVLQSRDRFISNTQAGMRDLAKQTGGIAFINSNDLNGGVRRVLDDQKGYYLIGYHPAGATFDRRFHKLVVKVKRPGLDVRTRKGFYGVTDEDARPARGGRKEQLLAAISSPFGADGITVGLTSLFADDPKLGSFVRSLVHIEARDLSFKDAPGGWHEAVFDVLGAAFDEQGQVVVQNSSTQTARMRGATYARVLRDGFVYNFNVPIKNPGAYQMRFAVRDAATGRVGSASQFIETPNLRKDRLALSGLYLSGADEHSARTLKVAESPSTVQAQDGAGQAAPLPDADVLAGPAVRRLHQRMSLGYAYFIYNAKLDPKSGRPQVAAQARIFRDGKLIFEEAPRAIEMSEISDFKRIAVGGGFRLGSTLPIGEYILQVLVTDQLRPNKFQLAAQWIDFEIIE